MSLLDRFKLRTSGKSVLNDGPDAEIPRDDEDDKKKKKKKGDDEDANDDSSTTNPAIKDSSSESEDPEDKKEDKMSTSTTQATPDSKSNPTVAAPVAIQPVAATFAELSAMVTSDVPDRDSFIVSCLGSTMTVAQAQTALNAHCLGVAKKATEQAKMAQSLAGVSGGAPAVPTKSTPGVARMYADFTEYGSLVEHLHLNGINGKEVTRAEAVMHANKHRPDLRAAYVGRSN